MELLGVRRNLGTWGNALQGDPIWEQEEMPPAAARLTTDEETIPVQSVGAQLCDAVGLLAQLPVQLLSVQPGAGGTWTVGADRIHCSAYSLFFSPGEGGTWELRHMSSEYAGPCSASVVPECLHHTLPWVSYAF